MPDSVPCPLCLGGASPFFALLEYRFYTIVSCNQGRADNLPERFPLTTFLVEEPR
jgi:hypothetical protein